METVSLSPLEPGLAAELLRGFEAFDPSGTWRAEDIPDVCERGLCFAATVGKSQGVYVLHVKGGKAWLQAAVGMGPTDLVRNVLPAIELQLAGNADRLAFMTGRRGLVKKAAEQGYRVAGWVLAKDLPWN